MKQTVLFALFVALLCAGCTQVVEQEEPELEGRQLVFEASWGDDNATRTAIQEDGSSVWWTTNEAINVFYGNRFSGKFVSTNTEPAKSASFSGTLSVVTGTVEEGGAASSFWAVYPYLSSNTCDGDNVTLVVAGEQTAKDGSFADKSFPAIAKSQNLDLSFYNVCGGVAFSLSRDGISKVVFRGNNNETLAGQVKVSLDNQGRPYVVENLSSVTEVELTVPGGGCFKKDVYYYIVSLPVTLSSGYTMEFYKDGDEKATRKSTSSVNIRRSVFGRLTHADEGLTFVSTTGVDLGLSVRWAPCNVGASEEWQKGGRYAWGELVEKNHYNWDNYKWCNGSQSSLTKYCTNSNYGTVDGKTRLDPEDDVATVTMGENWRMPTKEEMNELITNCTWIKTTSNGVSGYRVTGTNGNSIFIPVSGQYDESGLTWQTSAFLWTSDCDVYYNAYNMKNGYINSNHRHDGLMVRGVYGTPPPQNNNIMFSDAAAKYACVAKYDTDGDGEVSYEEAEAATSFNGLFTNWGGVVSFDEIIYFKNVHSLSGVFKGCNKLVSITVPESITDLGTYAFSGCTSLASVELPSGITAIGNYTFQNCSTLATIDIPSTVTSIGQYAFSGCSALTSVDLPSGLTSISNYTFVNCSNLSSVNIPSGVTSIGQYAFYDCYALGMVDLPSSLKTIGQYAFAYSSLTQIVIPDGVTSLGNYVFSNCSKLTVASLPSSITSIPTYCFQDCYSLTSVLVPSGVTSVGNYAFTGVKMWKLELPSSISSLGSNCFGSIVCVILPSSSPVSIQNNTFSGVFGIFVPSNMIAMYGAMTNWVNYSTKLHPIDAYKDKNEFTLATSGAVDMGTSVKWAAYNVGATKPEEYGDYYAWGEVQPKYSYKTNNYKWCNGDLNKLTKYCPVDKTDYWAGEGTPDGKVILDLEDDAARVNWGGNWRMPTYEEWTELRTDCLWEWTSTYEGTAGFFVYDFKKGNIIFIPAAGERSSTSVYHAGDCCFYWSSSLNQDYPVDARRVMIESYFVSSYYSSRAVGHSVRPVCE